MTRDDLLLPVSDEAPCGPDLEATQDEEFDLYYFGALGRLPSFFFRPGVQRSDDTRSPDHVFNPKSIELESETRQINGLLARSRDLRLLVLRAQWEILAGHLDRCTETVMTIAALLNTFGDAVHPMTLADRRTTLADLNAQFTMVQPLQFLGLTGTNEASLRKLRVAQGLAAPLASEDDVDLAQIDSALKDASNRGAVTKTFETLTVLCDALHAIAAACKASETIPFDPALHDVMTTAQDMRQTIASALPQLSLADTAPSEAEPDRRVEQDGASAPTKSEKDMGIVGPKVVSHAHARALLERCEEYYSTSEPSSATLLLVTQARLLIGKPLVEAMETLLPQKTSEAVVDFGPQTGFALNFERLRQLTESARKTPKKDLDAPAPPSPDPVTSSSSATAVINAVEEYFRRTEMSSPVPILLQRARSYAGRNFQSLMDELLPRSDGG